VTEFLREKHPKNSYDIRMSSSSTLIVLEATLADVPALQSIFARAIYPVSPYMKKAIPDTSQVAEWWGYCSRNSDKRSQHKTTESRQLSLR